jgi:hypothetical protein
MPILPIGAIRRPLVRAGSPANRHDVPSLRQMPPPQRPPPTPQTAPPPGSGLQSTISFLIFLHFFFLLVGIKASTGSPSALDQDLADKVPGLRAYLQLLAMDTDYMWNFTDYDPTNPNQYTLNNEFVPTATDFVVEVDVPQENGSIQTISWPNPAHARASIGRTRLEQLLEQMIIMSEVENPNSDKLAHVIARRIMAETRCAEASKQQPMTVRFRRRLLQVLLPNPELTPEQNKTAMAEEYARDPLDPSYLQTSFEMLAYMTTDNVFQTTSKKAASNTAAPANTPNRHPGPRPTGTPLPTGGAS